MRKYFYALMVAVFATMSLAVTGCSKDDDGDTGGDIVGTWKENNLDAVGITNYNQFRSDGTCVSIGIYDKEFWGFDDAEVDYGKWSRSGDELKIDGYTYKIVKLTSSELGISAFGITSYYKRVPDAEVEKYIK